MPTLWKIEIYKGKNDCNCKAIKIAAWIRGREEPSVMDFEPVHSFFEGAKINYQTLVMLTKVLMIQ